MRISDWSSDVCSSDLRKSIARKSLDRKFIARPSTQETTGFILNHDQRIALARAVIRWIDEVAKGLDSNGALQHYALRSSHLEAGEFWVEIRHDVSSSAIKIDCSEMPRFQRCLAQAEALAPVERLTIDQQRGRRIAPSYGVAATIPIVNGRLDRKSTRLNSSH